MAHYTAKCFLDGDWCWNIKPFIVSEETKNMVLDNITYLLNSFLSCSEYENIIFCWVMHDESIMEDIFQRLINTNFKLTKLTLTISERALKQRIIKDVESHVRTIDVLERSLPRIRLYDNMDTIKIDVSNITPRQAAERILEILL